MSQPSCLTPVVALLVVLGVTSFSVQAARNVNSNEQRRINRERQDFDQAEKKVQQARKALDQAIKQVREAESAVRQSSNQWAKAWQAATKEHSARLDYQDTIQERDAAVTAANRRRDEIVNHLQQRADYQAAQRDAETARQQLQEVSDDLSLPAEERHKRISALTGQTRLAADLQYRELNDDPELKEARRRQQVAEQKLARVQEELSQAVKKDPAVAKAEKAMKKAAEDAQKARREETVAGKALDTAQAAANRANQQYRDAVRDAQRDNRQRRNRNPR